MSSSTLPGYEFSKVHPNFKIPTLSACFFLINSFSNWWKISVFKSLWLLALGTQPPWLSKSGFGWTTAHPNYWILGKHWVLSTFLILFSHLPSYKKKNYLLTCYTQATYVHPTHLFTSPIELLGCVYNYLIENWGKQPS